MNTPINEAPRVDTTHRAPVAADRALAALRAALARGLQPFRRRRIARLELVAMSSHEARDLGIDTGIARFAASGGFIQR